MFFRGTHALMAAAWLLFDFLVFWLHFDVKNPSIPLARRLERAHIMHRIDQIVGLIFLLMLPSGIVLFYVTDTALFSTTWLNHAKDYVEKMMERFELDATSYVVEIAANDGYLLQFVVERGIPCLGVEPTASTAAAARRRG